MGAEGKLWFWRRVLASIIDSTLGALAFTLLFVGLVGGASDYVRLDGFGVSNKRCGATKASDEVLAAAGRLVPNVTWTAAELCTIDSFGLAENRVVVVSQKEKIQSGTLTRFVTVPVDAAGRPVSPFYADWIGLLAVVAITVAFLASRMQATPGLRMMGLRLHMDDGTRPNLRTLILRELCLFIPPVVAIGAIFGTFWLIVGGGASIGIMFAVIPLVFVGVWLWWRPSVVMRTWPSAPLHDVLTRTRMIRPLAS